MFLFHLIPEEPYSNDYNTGAVHATFPSNRKYIHLYNTNTLKAKGTSYARYLYQIQYWKDHKKWIPDNLHVDHINNDCTDDRLENFQLLTPKENNLKRDEFNYKQDPVDSQTLELIASYLQQNLPYKYIADRFDISRGHLRYIVRKYFPHLDQYCIIELNINEIKDLLEKEIPYPTIGDRYGVSGSTIARYIDEHLPDYSRKEIQRKKLDFIRECLSKGETSGQIAKKLKCDVSNVSYYITVYFPEYRTEMKKQKDEETFEFISKIKDLLEKNLSQIQIAKILNSTTAIVQSLISKHLPEYCFMNAYDIRVKKVGDLIKKEKTKKEMAVELNVSQKVIDAIIRKHYPELSRDKLYSDKLKNFKILIESENNYTLSEIAKELNFSYVMISLWLKVYYPLKYATLTTYEKKQEIISLDKNNPGISYIEIASKTNVPYAFVTSTLKNNREKLKKKRIEITNLNSFTV